MDIFYIELQIGPQFRVIGRLGKEGRGRDESVFSGLISLKQEIESIADWL